MIDRFDSTYWSGLDTRIYFNNIRIDEAVQISYQILEQIMPVYQYSHYVPTRMVQGQRLIVGEITTTFKRDGFIHSLIAALSDKSDTKWLNNGTTREENKPAQSIMAQNGVFNFNETTLSDLKAGNYKGKALTDIVEKLYNKNLKSSDYGAYTPTVHNQQPMFFTGLEGFDITIIHGAQIKNEQVLRYNANGDSYPDITNIHEPRVADKIGTGRKILGAFLGGSSKSIDDSGRPLMETFTFQAKNTQVLDIKDLEIG